MSFEMAMAFVVAVSLFGNRIFSLLTGLILRVPATWLLPTVYAVDIIQIPFYYWIYENGAAFLNRLPMRIRGWFSRAANRSPLGKWTNSLGGAGVFAVATLPSFGGGIWSAVFLAYGLRLKRSLSYLLIGAGSLVSYLVLYWVLDTLVRAVRYFV
jgi:hypothetical protein